MADKTLEVVDLLDEIDDTAPRCCQTCIYMATHEKCEGCLHSPEDYAEKEELRANSPRGERPPDMPFRYLNWKPGDWLRRVHAHEVDGRRNIVIGGSGEAEVNTRWTPQETATHLHRIACECGYMIGQLGPIAGRGDETGLSVWTESQFRLCWDKADSLARIEHIPESGTPETIWSVDSYR